MKYIERSCVVIMAIFAVATRFYPDIAKMDTEPVFFTLLMHLSSFIALFLTGRWMRDIIDRWKQVKDLQKT